MKTYLSILAFLGVVNALLGPYSYLFIPIAFRKNMFAYEMLEILIMSIIVFFLLKKIRPQTNSFFNSYISSVIVFFLSSVFVVYTVTEFFIPR